MILPTFSMESLSGSIHMLNYGLNTLIVDFDKIAKLEIRYPGSFSLSGTVAFTNSDGTGQNIVVDREYFEEAAKFTDTVREALKQWIITRGSYRNDVEHPVSKYYGDLKLIKLTWGPSTVYIYEDGLQAVKHLGDHLILQYGNREDIKLVSKRVDFLDMVQKEVRRTMAV